MTALGMLALLATQAPAAGAAPYWQQRLDYSITATLDEPSGTLSGTETVVYHNNSPDTLRIVAFHLYLNAFRPGSRWSDADSAEGRRRFNDLGDPDFGFNRVRNVTIDGQGVEPMYPLAPDSTIVRFNLPAPVAPGGAFTVDLGWEARPSTVPRRQGRRGRHFDFAQWYPRVVAYDTHGWQEHPLYPAGEFYGDFGDFTVRLDVPADQVVGATGVPVCGDPGWERANQVPARMVEYGRDAYGAIRCDDFTPPAPGRKRIVWMARDVHHFALSMNPAYLYEGGRFGKVLVHVLYRPGDEKSWGGGLAVQNTATALQWLDGLFGPFVWPQITNVHRIERGGTEFPMMVQDGSAGLGLILHEVGHNYLMGILANNEWREGFLDEGLTSFQTTWYQEVHRDRTVDAGRGAGVGGPAQDEWKLLLSDLDGWSEPTSLVSERYRDFDTYNRMVYDRGGLFYHQLRSIVGDSVMRAILRTYYARWKLRHVDEAAFKAVAESVSRRDLSTFFAQWLHGTALYDYSLGKVKTTGRSDGWTTRVEVVRKSPGVFPVEVMVRTPTDSVSTLTDGIAEREWVTVTTRGRPRAIEIDPGAGSHDWNVLNNRKQRGLLGFMTQPRREFYLDRLFSQRSRRDRMTVGLVPTLWYNDRGGMTLGGRIRSDYLGRFEQNLFSLSIDTRRIGHREDGFPYGVGMYFRLRNPTRLYAPRTSRSLEAYWVEGRAGLSAAVERQTNNHRVLGAQTFLGASARWLVTTDTKYLDPALWDAGGTVEGAGWLRSSETRGAWTVAGSVSIAGGVEYRNRGAGLTTGSAYDAQPYARISAEGTARRALGSKWGVGLRVYGGAVASGERPLKQRQIFLAGADPYAQFANPFLRSRGAPLAGSDVHYQMPGGGGVRGLAVGATSTRAAAVNGELDRSVLSRPTAGLFHEIRLAAFGDLALGNGDIPSTGVGSGVVADAGVGIRMSHRIGQSWFVTRIDFPVMVSRPRLAVSDGSSSLAFRWVVSFSPAFGSVGRQQPAVNTPSGVVGDR
jgi:hypothetical protein